MMTPATASTGTSALTPMSGASAAVRMMPVPKPPTLPITAAPRPSRATAASVSGSSSKLARYGARPAVAVDGDVGEGRFRHLDRAGLLRPAFGKHLDRHGDRGGADALELDVERQHVADLHRLLEYELLHRDGGDAAARDAAGDGAAGDVHLRHDPAAEYVAVLVGVGRHRHDAQRGLLAFGQLVQRRVFHYLFLLWR